jgi:hypothetical protein
MPAHRAAEDARERALVAGIHVCCGAHEDVDGRDVPGHDASTWFDLNETCSSIAAKSGA